MGHAVVPLLRPGVKCWTSTAHENAARLGASGLEGRLTTRKPEVVASATMGGARAAVISLAGNGVVKAPDLVRIVLARLREFSIEFERLKQAVKRCYSMLFCFCFLFLVAACLV